MLNVPHAIFQFDFNIPESNLLTHFLIFLKGIRLLIVDHYPGLDQHSRTDANSMKLVVRTPTRKKKTITWQQIDIRYDNQLFIREMELGLRIIYNVFVPQYYPVPH